MATKKPKNYLDNAQEARMLSPALTFKDKKIRTRDIARIKGTSVYMFHYRSKLAHDENPLIMLVGRAGGGAYFKYPPPAPRAKGSTYIAAINLSVLDPGPRKYLLEKYGRMSYIPTAEALKLEDIGGMYRIYDARKVRGLYPVDVATYLELI